MQPFTFFISYRRQDTAPVALLLKNEIEKRLQFVRVSVDVGEMLPGDEFPERLRRLIDEAHCTIALVGRHWLVREHADRDDADRDWVVEELEYSATAPLKHVESDRYGLSKREVVPIFVDCDKGFAAFTLPERLRFLSSLHGEHIGYAGWPSTIGPMLERLAVKLLLKKRPDKDQYPHPDPSKARTQPLNDQELRSILTYDDYDGWYVDNFGDAEARYIAKTFKFANFNQAADFMKMVSDHCRILDHHPEWRNVFSQVTVALTTWDARRKVTIYDLNIALFMNMAARIVRKRQ
jgi:pterin-4a-carbinolamine dehydratase